MQRSRKILGFWVVIGFFMSLVLSGCGGDGGDTVTDNAPEISQVDSSVFSDTDNAYPTGSMVRIDVEESSGEDDIVTGMIQITSASQGYDSGIQDLTFGSIFYQWDTTDLNPASDYVVEVELTDEAGQTTTDNSLVITLSPNLPAMNRLVSEVDISVAAQGLPVRVVRTYLLDSGFDGPLGFGWTHTYVMHIVKTADGLVKVFNSDGSGAFFRPNDGGTYDSPKGDLRTLVKNPDGTYQLKQKCCMLFQFDAGGKLTSLEDNNGNSLTFVYDSVGLLDRITDTSGQITTFTYDANNRLASVTDPAGQTVSYGYDGAGDLTSVANIGGFETTYAYDANHNLTTITDPTGHRTFIAADANDRLGTISNKGGNNSLFYEYGVPSPDQITITDAHENKTIKTYNNNGMVTAITDALGNTTVQSFDDDLNLISETDGNGHQTLFTYDTQGNLLTKVDAKGNAVSFTYEPLFDKMSSLTDAKGNTTTFDYDANGNLITTTYPDGSTETFEYDAAGNQVSKTDRRGQTINLTYDFRGRLTAKLFPDGSSHTFTYDVAGSLLSATDDNGTIDLAYNSINRLVEVNYPGGETVSYEYDEAGKRTQCIYPDGTIIDYEYDEAGRLTRIKRSGEVIASYFYELQSRPIQRELLNGTFTTYSYDEAGHLFDLVNNKSDSEIVSRFSYTYDNVGNRLTMTTLDGTTSYTYDATGQLINVVFPDASTTAYDYDPAGNRNSVTEEGSTTTYTANELNQYTDVGETTYTYDANGKVTSETNPSGTTSFTYDFENRLIQVDTPTETITYEYDPFGRRTSKIDSSGRVSYIYSDKQVIMEKDDFGEVLATYIYGLTVDEVLVMCYDEVDYFYSQDGLGSVTDITDEYETLLESYSYDAYGNTNDSSSVGNPYRFTGRRLDSETDLYYYRARYYDPQLGRFVSEDPIGLVGGLNLYNYVSNNPINIVDPTGLEPSHPPGLTGCSLMHWRCEALYCNPLWILFDWTSCLFCRHEYNEKCGGTRRGDPTFIQVSRRQVKNKLHNDSFSEHDALVAKISVPCEDSLVRGNVPIFGLAYGENFKEYRIEYGESTDPKEWVTISTSPTPQTTNDTAAKIHEPGDFTIKGNLTTWDTGLKNYVYLPSHPKDHPIDLKGPYTLRLVVTAKDGSTVEDRVTVNVANVIPNAWGGIANSKDQNVILAVPEQSLMDSFRLVLIHPIEKGTIASSQERQLIGNIYEIREGGERFTKTALLQMAFSEEGSKEINPDRLGIYGYDPKTKDWKHLNSRRTANDNLFFTDVKKLFPYYVLMASDLPGEGSAQEPISQENQQTKLVSSSRTNDYFLVRDNFEDSLGEWSNRDGEVGAGVKLDDTATFDGARALKVTNINAGGNFAVNVRKTPFDARRYPLVQFDYRIPPHVKTNFFVKVSGRWFEIGFTDDFKEVRNKRVNIAHIGDIGGVVADDQWHTAQFNLYEMLRTKTGNSRVDQMIMADWDVKGYMKLQFGKNRKGVTYYVDNFTISRAVSASLRIDDNSILVDHFNQKNKTNSLGGTTTIFSDGKEGHIVASFSDEDAAGRGYALKFSYDVSQPGSYAGYTTMLQNLDLRGYHILTFFAKGLEEGQDLLIGLKDWTGQERKVPVSAYLPGKITSKWQQVSIPLTAFSNELEWSGIHSLIIAFENSQHKAGTVFADIIEFHKELKSVLVENFERSDGKNLLDGKHWTFAHGAAATNGAYSKSSPNGIYGISYGGNIGDVYGYDSGLNYAGWTTALGGIDCSRCATLSFHIRGAKGGEEPNIYLDDGNFRWGVDIEKYAEVTTEWQSVTIPLSGFAGYGVDLTHLSELQVVFEWEKMSGTIYLDDIRFGLQPH